MDFSGTFISCHSKDSLWFVYYSFLVGPAISFPPFNSVIYQYYILKKNLKWYYVVSLTMF